MIDKLNPGATNLYQTIKKINELADALNTMEAANTSTNSQSDAIAALASGFDDAWTRADAGLYEECIIKLRQLTHV